MGPVGGRDTQCPARQMTRCPAHFGGNPGQPQHAFPLHRKHGPLGDGGQHRSSGPCAQDTLISLPTPENATRSLSGPTLQHRKNTRHIDKGTPLILWHVFFGAVPLSQQSMRKKAQKSRTLMSMKQLHNPSDRGGDHATESPSVLPLSVKRLRGEREGVGRASSSLLFHSPPYDSP